RGDPKIPITDWWISQKLPWLFLFGSGVLLAWRWIIMTALLFGALVLVNSTYVYWLAPLAH
ncbi:MAG TPA: hypothetical protein VEF90_03830, partial [Xanthobacteraceae bacterium]|nr:hypothetical protein [Xanthobacteraceae bacterium]